MEAGRTRTTPLAPELFSASRAQQARGTLSTALSVSLPHQGCTAAGRAGYYSRSMKFLTRVLLVGHFAATFPLPTQIITKCDVPSDLRAQIS